MILLTLDTSVKRTGYAVGPVDGRPVLGSYSLPKFSNMQIGKLLLAHERWVKQMIELHKPDAIGIEAPVLPKFGANITTRRKLFGLVDTTDKICAAEGITCFEVVPSKIKKFITGDGFAKKVSVVEAVETLGLAPRNDDEADAAALWLLALSWFDRRDRTTNAQRWFMGTHYGE